MFPTRRPTVIFIVSKHNKYLIGHFEWRKDRRQDLQYFKFLCSLEQKHDLLGLAKIES